MLPKRRRPQWVGAFAGMLIGAGFAVYLWTSPGESLRVHGPMISGHGALQCAECHEPAEGTIRQQLQGKVRFWLGMRATDVMIGFEDVDNDDCLACHDRPRDRHPVHRFLEPRFAAAREAIAPHSCVSCHREHSGERVRLEPDYCQHCHEDTRIEDDPALPSHASLIALNRWDSCLQCHDFHGNHVFVTPTSLTQAISREQIVTYFRSGASPYGDEKVQEASSNRQDESTAEPRRMTRQNSDRPESQERMP